MADACAEILLENARVTLTDLSDGMTSMGYDIETQQPEPDVIDRVRKLVHRELEERSLSFRV